MNRPLVSVVIPHFNRPRLLAEAVASVLASTYDNVEVIVVDDGSDPSDRSSIDKLASTRVRIIDRLDGTKGPSRCRNLGVGACCGDLVVFLDSDDLTTSWCIEERVAYSQQSPDSDFWVFPVGLFSQVPGDRDFLWNRLTTEDDDALRFASADPPWHTSSPLWRKQSFLKTGGLNERVMYGDDTDLHLRALVQDLKYSKNEDALPDAFVRRSSEPRITSGLSDSLIASRRIRLVEGVKALDTLAASPQLVAAFDAQHFVEGEFLLFNASMPSVAIRELFPQWDERAKGRSIHRQVAKLYLKASALLRDRSFLAVRVARRLAISLLPREYFPAAGTYSEAILSSQDSHRLRARLKTATGRPACPNPVEHEGARGWLDREVTDDEREVVAWLEAKKEFTRILHMGIGNSYAYKKLRSRIVQGITKDTTEADHAEKLGAVTLIANKYDVASYQANLVGQFDCVIDVNIRSYACCDLHFREYMESLRMRLPLGGVLITGKRGLDYLIPTSLSELRALCPSWSISVERNIVLMHPERS